MTTMDSVERLKGEGNAHFDAGRWDAAVAAYLDGLSALPAVPVEGEGEAATDTEGGTDGEEERTRVLRVQLYSNLAAAYLKLGDAAGAMEAATNALRHDPGYSKARYRRAVAAESLGGWSNLSQALDDYALVDSPEAQAAAQRIRPRLELAAQTEKTEMLNKLRGIGDSLLGTFGLSTRNFAFTPQEGGGYSMQFKR